MQCCPLGWQNSTLRQMLWSPGTRPVITGLGSALPGCGFPSMVQCHMQADDPPTPTDLSKSSRAPKAVTLFPNAARGSQALKSQISNSLQMRPQQVEGPSEITATRHT